MSAHQKSQSFIITGVSGAGKTESAKQILKFFCGLLSDEYALQMSNVNSLIEAFGNSHTTENFNSSHYMKILQVNIFFGLKTQYLV